MTSEQQKYWLRAGLVSISPLLIIVLIHGLVGLNGLAAGPFLILLAVIKPAVVFSALLPLIFLPQLELPLRFSIVKGICFFCLQMILICLAGFFGLMIISFSFEFAKSDSAMPVLIILLRSAEDITLLCLTALLANLILDARIPKYSFIFLAFFSALLSLIVPAFSYFSPASIPGLSTINSSVWYFAAALALAYESSHATGTAAPDFKEAKAIEKRNVRLGNSKRRTKKVLKTILILLLILAAVGSAFFVVTSALSYNGYCYGFTDGKWQCSFFESLSQNFFYFLLLGWPLVFLWLLTFTVCIVSLLLLGRKEKE